MPATIEEPEQPVDQPNAPETPKPVYTGLAAQLEAMLSQIHEIEVKKSKAEQDAEVDLAEILRLEAENKCLKEQVGTLEKDLASEKRSLSMSISGARNAAAQYKHEIAGLIAKLDDIEKEKKDLEKQVTSQKRLRKLGESCRHCGKNYETGLRPGEPE
jgi:chromosome segregation ATPase